VEEAVLDLLPGVFIEPRALNLRPGNQFLIASVLDGYIIIDIEPGVLG